MSATPPPPPQPGEESLRAKLLDAATAAHWVEQRRARGERVIVTSGCFDLLHVGHVRSLWAARALGQHLLVALNSDGSVRALKGEGRPYFPQRERAEVLASLSMVDRIVVVEELTMDRLLQQLKPHVFAKGTDYSVETIPERATVLGYGGELAVVGDPKTRSTRHFRPTAP